MSKEDFSHLHVHTQYSVLDGINRIDQLAKYVKTQGMKSCAITDHGTLYGWIEFYKECEKAGVKPIIGVEAYLTDDEDGIEDNKYKSKDNYHCILLAQNETGIRNIIWLTNQANINNFYYRPRISIKNLQNGRHEGIIATSSCLGGIVSKIGVFDKNTKEFVDEENKARNKLMLFSEIFQDKFYAEIQDNPEFWEQEAYNRWLIKHARQNNIPTVITSDAHYLTKEDKKTHDLVMAQQMKVTLEEYSCDDDGLVYGKGHYIRTPDEMLEAAIKYDCEEAFWHGTEIADKCNFDFSLGKYENPDFDIKTENDYQDFKQWKETKKACECLVKYK